ncbi:hypothetical protein BHE74_00024851 [Ensete ventricosum]|nr:hypothetical protein BHE74_00024851 [Ensete ventricosum]
MCPERGYMLYRVGTAIIQLQHREPKVLQDRLVPHLRHKGGFTEFNTALPDSFDLMNSFWTSSIFWFIRRNCASESVEDHGQAAAWLGVVLPKIMPREGLREPADVVDSTATRARGCRGQSLGSSPPRPALVE